MKQVSYSVPVHIFLSEKRVSVYNRTQQSIPEHAELTTKHSDNHGLVSHTCLCLSKRD